MYIAVEVSALVGAGVPAFSMSYTNSAGTAGRTGAGIIAGVASSGAGSWYLMGLDAGDVGVRSIQTFTLSATWTSGTIALVAFRPIVQIPLLQSSSIVTINQSIKVEDALTMAAPRIWNSSVLQYVFVSNSTSNICANGLLTLAQG